MGNNQESIRLKLLGALQQLWEEVATLGSDLSEAALKHSFSNALAKKFKGWDIDCDYNPQAVWPIERPSSKKIFPDIIIHKRNQPNERLLAIEVKKVGCPPKAIKRDREYLYEYMTQLDYRYASFVFLPTTKALEENLENMIHFHPTVVKELSQVDSSVEELEESTTNSTNDPSTETLLKELNKRLDKINEKPQKAPLKKTAQTIDPKETLHEIIHSPEPLESENPNGIVNEHMLEPSESSPLIYADQLPHSPAPAINAFSQYDPTKPVLRSLGLDWKAIEHKEKRAKAIAQALDVDGKTKSCNVEVTKVEATPKKKKQAPKGGIFPSRIYVGDEVLKNQRSLDQFEHLPTPQKPTKPPFEVSANANQNYQDN